MLMEERNDRGGEREKINTGVRHGVGWSHLHCGPRDGSLKPHLGGGGVWVVGNGGPPRLFSMDPVDSIRVVLTVPWE